MNKSITLEELFADLNARLFDIRNYIKNYRFIISGEDSYRVVNPDAILEEISSQIFRFPIGEAIKRLDLVLAKIVDLSYSHQHFKENTVNTNFDEPSIGQVSEEDEVETFEFFIEIEGELSTYYHHLEPIMVQLLFDERRMLSQSPADDESHSIEHRYIKTNCSARVLIALFRSMYEFYPNPLKKPIKEYVSERDYHRAVISCLLPIGGKKISFGSYESKYDEISPEQIAAADTVHDFLENCLIATTNYKNHLVNAPDKEGKKKKK